MRCNKSYSDYYCVFFHPVEIRLSWYREMMTKKRLNDDIATNRLKYQCAGFHRKIFIFYQLFLLSSLFIEIGFSLNVISMNETSVNNYYRTRTL